MGGSRNWPHESPAPASLAEDEFALGTVRARHCRTPPLRVRRIPGRLGNAKWMVAALKVAQQGDRLPTRCPFPKEGEGRSPMRSERIAHSGAHERSLRFEGGCGSAIEASVRFSSFR